MNQSIKVGISPKLYILIVHVAGNYITHPRLKSSAILYFVALQLLVKRRARQGKVLE
jgi:hypothetical protein